MVPFRRIDYRCVMRRVERNADIAASPAEIYAFLADPANLPRWQTGIVSAERTSPAPTQRGSTARVVRELMGQRIAADITVTEAVPDHRLVVSSTVSGISVTASLDLTPQDAGTRVVFAMEIRAQNVFMAPVEGMVAGGAEQELDSSLARLRSALAATGP
jgi:carbon monoxide dehydrogenase subunit G